MPRPLPERRSSDAAAATAATTTPAASPITTLSSRKRTRTLSALVALALTAASLVAVETSSARADEAPAPTPTVTSTPDPSETPAPTPTAPATADPTTTPAPDPQPTPTDTATPTPSPTTTPEPTPTATPSAPVSIADPALLACALTALGRSAGDTVTAADLASLTTLTCPGVADLTGIAAFTGLTNLDLSHGTIADVAPLAALTGLQTVNLQGNRIRDLSPLATLAASAQLDIRDQTLTGLTQTVGRPFTPPTPVTPAGAAVAYVAQLGATVNPDGTVAPAPAAVGTTARLGWSAVSPTTDTTTARFSGTYAFPVAAGTVTAPTAIGINGSAMGGQRLVAAPGTWAPADVSLTYQWFSNGIAIPGATGATYVVPFSAAPLSLSVTVTGAKDGYVSKGKPSVSVFTSLLPFARATAPVITGVPKLGQTLGLALGIWTPVPASFRYQWYRDGVAISGATAATYVLPASSLGASITASATAIRAGYSPAARTSARVVPVAATFHTAAVPVITGTPKVGQRLGLSIGSWSPAASFTYQWYRNGVGIPGATAASYVLPLATAGTVVSARVTGTSPGYIPFMRTTAGVKPPLLAFSLAPTPRITGTLKVGQTLGLSLGTWSPSGIAFTYQWYRNGVAISGARAATYALPVSAAGATFTARVVGSKAGYTSLARTTAGVRPTLLTLSKTSAPTIRGAVALGQTLTAVPGTWSPRGVAFAYRWYRNGTAISGATRATYVLTASDVRRTITVRVTGSKAGYTSVSRSSKGVAVPPASLTAAPTPTLTGSATSGGTLVAHVGTWAPSGVRVTVQWYRNGIGIAGATAASYKVRSGDVGAVLSVRASGSKAGYTSLSRGSKGVRIAAPAAPPVPPAAPVASAHEYKNCTALHVDYPHGVARQDTTFDLRSGYHKPVFAGTVFSTPLYEANRKSDADHDGIACEKR